MGVKPESKLRSSPVSHRRRCTSKRSGAGGVGAGVLRKGDMLSRNPSLYLTSERKLVKLEEIHPALRSPHTNCSPVHSGSKVYALCSKARIRCTRKETTISPFHPPLL